MFAGLLYVLMLLLRCKRSSEAFIVVDYNLSIVQLYVTASRIAVSLKQQ